MSRFSEAYSHHTQSKQLTWCRVFTFAVVVLFIGLVGKKLASTTSTSKIDTLENIGAGSKFIKAATWNIAAINNNPFEYWITNDDPKYNSLMQNVSAFIEKPGVHDVQVKEIFTEKMFNELVLEMDKIGWNGVNETKNFWHTDFKNRRIISEFVKDSLLGKKRLASMPDRVTNTIHTTDGGSVMRPTVINCYDGGDLGSIDQWWDQWREFFFRKTISIKKKGTVTKTTINGMIPQLSRAKYPAVTELEQSVSIPLETLSLAIFDAILVSMMGVAGPSSWQFLRSDMCQKLNHKKNDRTVEILQTTYGDSDIVFLQEVAGNFPSFAKAHEVATLFDIHGAASMDADRDQNSFILLKNGKYRDIVEVTDQVIALHAKENNDAKLPVVNGDLVVLVVVNDNDGSKYLLASFHGDTNGLATKPVVSAVQRYAMMAQPDCKMIFGLDANTYAKPEKDQEGVLDFAKFYTDLKLNSCYGPNPNPLNFTTFHARTHLQPQLNKAVSLEDKDLKGDKNPKDFILFFDADFNVVRTYKDNTGKRKYIEGMVFPTLSFPSDHGVTSTILRENAVAPLSTPHLKGGKS